MEEKEQIDQEDELHVDVDNLTEHQLEELALRVVRKLRESMRQERDRSGRR